MGWISNYKWIKSLKKQEIPEINQGKDRGTKTELEAMSKLNSLSNVISVYHAKRLTEADTGLSRREIDIIVLKKDRIVLIEIKHYNGTVTMVDNILHQNDQNRLRFFVY